MHLEGKSVIVTAASKGLGKAIATEFAREGAHVLLGSRNTANLKTAVEEIQQETGNDNVSYVVCNMYQAKHQKDIIEAAVERHGTVDVLVNNAGGPPAGNLLDVTDAEWFQSFQANILSFIRTIRAAAPYMKQQQSGRIINLASSSVKESLDEMLISNTLRPGVHGMTKSLAQELGADNILINTLGPGTIETDRVGELNELRADREGISVDRLQQEAEEKIPMKRYGQPEEFARTAVFLGSGANTYITGQSLIVDGGLVKAL